MSADATIEIDSRPTAPIDPRIYGHFLEGAFYGNIEGGVLDEGSPRSVAEPGPLRGCRADLLAACARLGVPVLRWPGGNYASAYHWTDGVGPRDERPRRFDLAWGGEESNRFGTPEFLAWCAAVGAEPYLAHSCRDVEEAARWVEYVNYAGDTDLTRQRAADGHSAPYGVRWWGLGNEVYGSWQLGCRPAADYVADAREHARFMRKVDPSIRLVAVGQPDANWTRTVVGGLGGLADHISLHLYGTAAHRACADPRAEYDSIVAQSLYVEAQVGDYAALVAESAAAAGLDQPPAIALDEWNMRHLEPAAWPEPQPGADGGTADRDLDDTVVGPGVRTRVNRHSPRTMADALFYAGVFHALHRAAARPAPVTMANTVNLVNANGVFTVRPGGVVAQATSHVWDLYLNHLGRAAAPVAVRGPARTAAIRQGHQRGPDGSFATRPGIVPALDVAATLDDRALSVAVINRDADAALTAQLALDGRSANLPAVAEVRTITGEPFAHNSLADPARVSVSEPERRTAVDGRRAFPPRSVTLLTFSLA